MKILKKNSKEILSEAKSNIAEFGTGKDIYERFVKPSVVSSKEIACPWKQYPQFIKTLKTKKTYIATPLNVKVIKKYKRQF